ncbi:MAG: ATP-binding cassette domain-containing protein [Christensenellaceae bacterium]|jgi:putative ABC transport system ATP-binding protein|nr:ATP-binding cassette domain-containing protein [Christensenellaceae bacterium]
MIKLVNIHKAFGKKIVLSGINLEINEGEFVCIVGNSGAGKSTLLNLLALFDLPTFGEYFLDGTNVYKNNIDRAKVRSSTFGFVFQTFHLLEELTVAENVKIPLIYANKNADVETRINNMLGKFGLDSIINTKCKYLSGGEKQRVAFVRAVINNPKYILCDEPTGNLDNKNSQEIIQFLKEEQKNGKTIVFISHDFKTVEELKNEGATTYEINAGQIKRI